MFNLATISAFLLISVMAVFIAITLIINVWVKSKNTAHKNSAMFFSFTLDFQKNRIKINNDNEVYTPNPWFVAKTLLATKQWVSVNDFFHFFSEHDRSQIMQLIQDQKITKYECSITNKKRKNSLTTITFDFGFYDKKQVLGNVTWKITNAKENKVFKAINYNLEYLFDKNSKYETIVFILNTKNIYDITNFINIFKERCAKKNIYEIHLFLKWDKLFFVFPKDKFTHDKIKSSTKQIIDWARIYIKSYSKIIRLNEMLIQKIGEDNFEKFFDYIKLQYKTDDNILINNIFSNLFDSENYKKYINAFSNIEKIIRKKQNLEVKDLLIHKMRSKPKIKKEIILPKLFKNLDVENDRILESLDIHRNFYTSIYENLEAVDLTDKFILCKDFIFNTIKPESVIAAQKAFPSYVQFIEYTSYKSTNKLFETYNKLKQKTKKFALGLKIDQINDNVINIIGDWLKYIWIDKTLVNNINNPSYSLLINIILIKAKENKIKIILENFNYKLYKKTLDQKITNIMYTE
ncbi:MHO_4530 family protein [Metamycoplasma equirhinis]|uniref:MHO_4530 family protein n=1 Tax=Metamycoplasma equirhinis TaxID=92402 RepID=UPI0035934387